MTEGQLTVRVVDAAGNIFDETIDSKYVDLPCSVCNALHPDMNKVCMTIKHCYCNECFFKMGMRKVATGLYAHTATDTLFVNNMANLETCPTHVEKYGNATPYFLIQRVMEDAALELAINECLGPHGRSVTREDLQDEATSILNEVSDEQFECLVLQGKL